MKKIILIAALLYTMPYGQARSQRDVPPVTKNVFIDFQGNNNPYNEKASAIMRRLKNGSVIVRLMTSQRSIDAYRKAGDEKIAQRIENERKIQNQKIHDAFAKFFTFCKVYFIYAENTKKCLAGKHVFLNRNLAPDPSIALRDTNFIFCQYGSAQSYSRYSDISGFGVDEPSLSDDVYDVEQPHTTLDTVAHPTSTGPASPSCLFFLDKKGNQLFRPFPAPEEVDGSNYDDAVKRLNREMDRGYYDLVLKKETD